MELYGAVLTGTSPGLLIARDYRGTRKRHRKISPKEVLFKVIVKSYRPINM